MKEILKPSKFNYFFVEDNYMYLYNSYSGLSNMRKIEKNNSDTIKKILESTIIEKKGSYEEELCKLGYLVNYNEDEQEKLESAYLEYISSPILHLYILITEECNFRCLYCYQEHKPIFLNNDIQNGIINYVKKNIRRYTGIQISWFGGEPLLGIDIIKVMSEELIKICNANHRTYKADITTNGYLLTPSVVRELIKCKVLYYQVTVDGLKETHDKRKKLKNGDGTFDTIMNNLLEIKKNIKTKTIVILIRTNFLRSDLNTLKECINMYYQKFGDDERFMFAPGGAGDWGGDNSEGIDLDYFSTEDFPILFNELLKCHPLNYGFFHNLMDDGRNICYASKQHSYAIGADGFVYKCTCNFKFGENQLGFISSDGNLHIDKRKQMAFVIGALRHLDKECNSCFFSIRCAGSYCIVNSLMKGKENFVCFPPYTKSFIKEQILLLDKIKTIPVLSINA